MLFVVVVRSVVLDPKQHSALQRLYNDLHCSQTTKCPVFLSTEDCPATEANNLDCDDVGVVRISLDFMDLSGQLSSAIGDLTALQILSEGLFLLRSSLSHRSQCFNRDISFNRLTGTIPSHIGKLSNLEYL